MNDRQRNFIDSLRALVVGDDTDLAPELYELADLLEGEDVRPVLPAIFDFLEAHPRAELGSPGPLVHLVERTFPGGFEHLLIASLANKPVPHTTWMANRLLNHPQLDPAFRIRLLQSLESSVTHADADDVTKAQAARFLARQRG